MDPWCDPTACGGGLDSLWTRGTTRRRAIPVSVSGLRCGGDSTRPGTARPTTSTFPQSRRPRTPHAAARVGSRKPQSRLNLAVARPLSVCAGDWAWPHSSWAESQAWLHEQLPRLEWPPGGPTRARVPAIRARTKGAQSPLPAWRTEATAPTAPGGRDACAYACAYACASMHLHLHLHPAGECASVSVHL